MSAVFDFSNLEKGGKHADGPGQRLSAGVTHDSVWKSYLKSKSSRTKDTDIHASDKGKKKTGRRRGFVRHGLTKLTTS